MRKRRAQTLAEQGTATAKLYPWTSMLDEVFTFAPSPEVWAQLSHEDGKWSMAVRIGKQNYSGERPTLEEAFRATADLLYKHAKEFWLCMDSQAVTAPWAGELPEVTAGLLPS